MGQLMCVALPMFKVSYRNELLRPLLHRHTSAKITVASTINAFSLLPLLLIGRWQFMN